MVRVASDVSCAGSRPGAGLNPEGMPFVTLLKPLDTSSRTTISGCTPESVHFAINVMFRHILGDLLGIVGGDETCVVSPHS